MRRILRTIGNKGSLAKLMLTIGFHYKSALLIEEISDASTSSISAALHGRSMTCQCRTCSDRQANELILARPVRSGF
jgi:hypothetical protein